MINLVNENDVNDLLMCIANYVAAKDIQCLKGALDDIDDNIVSEVETIKIYCDKLIHTNRDKEYCLDCILYSVRACYGFLKGKKGLKEFIKELEMEELDNGFNI